MQIFTVDAFTDEPFMGNPAGVCILERPLPEEMYTLIAREINYSETAFLVKQNDIFHIRWFTPTTEVNLCGHATLAAAHVLYDLNFNPDKPVEFTSKSGRLTAYKVGDKIELNFPQLFVKETNSNEIIENAFDINPIYVGKNDNRYLIEIESSDKLRSIKPDYELLKTSDLGRFIITVKSDQPGYDFISRYFAPGVGVPEDPATGTAHCYLAPYWGRKLGKTTMKGFQASKRTGSMECKIIDNDRVLLRAKAVIMHELIPRWKLV